MTTLSVWGGQWGLCLEEVGGKASVSQNQDPWYSHLVPHEHADVSHLPDEAEVSSTGPCHRFPLLKQTFLELILALTWTACIDSYTQDSQMHKYIAECNSLISTEESHQLHTSNPYVEGASDIKKADKGGRLSLREFTFARDYLLWRLTSWSLTMRPSGLARATTSSLCPNKTIEKLSHDFNLITQLLSTGAEDCCLRDKTGNRRGPVVLISCFEQLMVCLQISVDSGEKLCLILFYFAISPIEKIFLKFPRSLPDFNWFSVIKALWGQDQVIRIVVCEQQHASWGRKLMKWTPLIFEQNWSWTQ